MSLINLSSKVASLGCLPWWWEAWLTHCSMHKEHTFQCLCSQTFPLRIESVELWDQLNKANEGVLVRVSTAMRRHHDQGNSYKGKHLIGTGLQFERFSPLSSWWEAWQHTVRHGAKSSIFWFAGNKRLCVTMGILESSEHSVNKNNNNITINKIP